MNNTIIIRSYDKDDYSAHICYMTMKKHGFGSTYVFFHEKGVNHPLIKSAREQIIYRGESGNFGGIDNVRQMMNDYQLLPEIKDDDFITISDSDIVMLKNPWDNYYLKMSDHIGIMGEAIVCPGVRHVSGQLNIIRGWLWNKYIKDGIKNVNKSFQYQVDNNSKAGTADDTIFSIFAYLNKASQYAISLNHFWIHDKTNNEEEYQRNLKRWIL